MDSRESVKQQLLELLRTVQSVDDIKEHGGEIFDRMEEIMQLGLQMVEDFFESADSMSPGEVQEGFLKFRDLSFMLDSDIESELNRIDDLPGSQAVMAGHEADMEKRLAEHGVRFESLMANNIDKFPEPMRSQLAAEYGSKSDGGPGPVGGPRQKLEELEFVYNMNTIDDLKNGKDKIIEISKEAFKRSLEELKEIKASGKPSEELRDKIDEVDNRMEIYGAEMDAEFNRLSKLPGADDFMNSFQEELGKQFQPLVMEFEGLLAELKGTGGPPGGMPPPPMGDVEGISCPGCGTIIQIGTPICPGCGAKFEFK